MMQNKPVIGIVPTFNLTNPNNDPYADRASFVRMYIDKINDSGGIPIGLLEENLEDYLELCDGFLWPGGTKIHASFYKIIEHALEYHKPVLGICMGCEAIATYFNELEDQKNMPNKTLNEVYDYYKEKNPYLVKIDEKIINNHSHIVTKEKESIDQSRHIINIKESSLLYSILKKKSMSVVSLHSMCINRLPDSLKINAKSLDNIIEGIEYTEHSNNILGVQFHPEIDEEKSLFDWLISKTRMEYQVLINKENKIDENKDYKIELYSNEFPHCDETNMNSLTKKCFLEWKSYLEKEGIILDIESGYRNIKRQEKIYNDNIKEYGLDHAREYVAIPGYSEHHTGLAIDICINDNSEWKTEFEIPNKIYKRLNETCKNYGFILRYPKGKESITGYAFEPWHFRFVGNELVARYIMDNNLTLEEYLCQK